MQCGLGMCRVSGQPVRADAWSGGGGAVGGFGAKHYDAVMERGFIVAEIKRLAADGEAPGRLRLEAEAGIKPYHWKRHWARYSDAVKEAGFSPNSLSEPYSDETLILHIVAVARDIGGFPTEGDLLVRRTSDPQFPSAKVFSRLGKKAETVAKVAAYCEAHGLLDVRAMCEATPIKPAKAQDTKAKRLADGHVYLIKSGKFYKIGFSVHAGARERQLAIQLPEAAATTHVIPTDDPAGIEAYWHRRFADKRKNGEWFDLSREDVAAFKRRKFM